MSRRQLIPSGSPLEPVIGFSRAVRVDGLICVAGTAPIATDGGTVGPGDVAAQAARCFEIIEEALRAAGASFRDVVRTRIFLTRMEDWPAIAALHGRIFSAVRPACTVMQVARFIDPEWLVEIEADALV